jgi:hypothetical protein
VREDGYRHRHRTFVFRPSRPSVTVVGVETRLLYPAPEMTIAMDVARPSRLRFGLTAVYQFRPMPLTLGLVMPALWKPPTS